VAAPQVQKLLEPGTVVTQWGLKNHFRINFYYYDLLLHHRNKWPEEMV